MPRQRIAWLPVRMLPLSGLLVLANSQPSRAQASFVTLQGCPTLTRGDVEQAIWREVSPAYTQATSVTCQDAQATIVIVDGPRRHQRSVVLEATSSVDQARVIGLAVAELWETAQATAPIGVPAPPANALPTSTASSTTGTVTAPVAADAKPQAQRQPPPRATAPQGQPTPSSFQLVSLLSQGTHRKRHRPSAAVEAGLRWFSGASPLWQLSAVGRYGYWFAGATLATRQDNVGNAAAMAVIDIAMYAGSVGVTLWCSPGKLAVCGQAVVGAGAISASGSTTDLNYDGLRETAPFAEGGLQILATYRNFAHLTLAGKYGTGMVARALASESNVRGPSGTISVGVGW